MADRQLDTHFATFVRTGDPAALEFVFVRCEERLRRRARRLVGDARAAEDLVQELFVALLCRHGTFEAGRPCLPYLIGALHRRAATWQAHRARQPQSSSAATLVADDSPVHDAFGRELLTAVRAALPKLTPPLQEVVHRYVECHEGPLEIARVVGRSTGTVRVQLHRGLRQLRDHLPKGFFALPFLLLLRPTSAAPLAPPAWSSRWYVVAAIASVAVVGVAMWSPTQPSGAALRAQLRTFAAADNDTSPLAPAAVVAASVERATLPEAPIALAVEVRFADGSPAAHVGIAAAPPGHDADFTTVRAITDADGRATLPALPAGPLRVSSDRGTNTLHVLRGGESAQVTITLPAAIRVRGRVVDADGKPMPGAAIWVNDVPRQPWEGRVVLHADDDGAFALRDLAPMTTFGAIVAGRVPSPMLAVGPIEGAPVSLRVGGPAATVTGTVVDEHGAAVTGAIVRVARHARSQFRLPGGDRYVELHPSTPVSTDERGSFAAANLPTGRLEVSVRSPAHAATLVPVWLDANTTRDLRIVLPAGAALAGVVRDPAGAPVPGASVLAHGPARHQWAGTFAGDDGAFVLAGLDPSRLVLEVEAEGFVTRELPVARGTRQLDVELQPMPRLRGRFVAADGSELDPADWELGIRPIAFTGERLSPGPVVVAADGLFSIEALPASDFFCRPLDDRVWLRCAVRAVDDGVEVRVPEGANEVGVLRVCLHGATAEQLADSLVVVQRDGEVYQRDSADPTATERLAVRLPVGDYHVTVVGRRGRCPMVDAGTITLEEEERVVDVTVPPAGNLQFRIDVPGRAIERCTGFVIDERGMQVPLVAPSGTLALAAGKWTFWAQGFTFMTIRGVPFEVRTGETTALVLPTRIGLVRHIAFTMPPGVTFADAHVTVSCHGECLLGDEPGVRQRGFDATADGYCCVPLVLAEDEYEVQLTAGARRFAGRFTVAGEEGVGAPVMVALGEVASAR
jgi:RNA polymerase sigma-70 factor, ECF subfamily